jgi:alpha-1,2-mannosyltransferase
MNDAGRRFKIGLLALGVFHLIYFCAAKFGETLGISGMLYANGTPVGGDFVNLWSVGKLILADRIGDIYDVDRFMAYQGSITGGADIGLRLWAYPAQSLLLAWPFGLFGYYAALAIWSLVGLAVLAIGARRFGFDGMEIAIVLMSPATVLNLYYGQTGSFAAGLMLLALSPRSARDPIPIAAAALLTIKPQAGFLLPVLWAFQRRWQLIAITALAVIGLVALSIAVFGLEPWRGYLGDTVPVLSALESEGSGPFMAMIPSLFMALRIVTGDSGLAMLIHVAFAAIVLVVLLSRLWRIEDANRRAAMVLIATVLMTPYMHNYDLALLLCGALLVARRWSPVEKGLISVDLLVLLAWALPHVVVTLNRGGVPISPLLILPLLLAA